MCHQPLLAKIRRNRRTLCQRLKFLTVTMVLHLSHMWSMASSVSRCHGSHRSTRSADHLWPRVRSPQFCGGHRVSALDTHDQCCPLEGVARTHCRCNWSVHCRRLPCPSRQNWHNMKQCSLFWQQHILCRTLQLGLRPRIDFVNKCSSPSIADRSRTCRAEAQIASLNHIQLLRHTFDH